VGSGPDDRRDDSAVARATAGAITSAVAGVTAGDRVAAAADELYGADPEAFTGRRGELAAAARGAGDRAAAKAIAALRRPTRAAWVVNRLARADRSAPQKLAELAAALRAAQEARHGPRLRELSAARGSLVDALTAQALAVANVPDPPPSLRLEVTQTLTAVIADPEVAADFAKGTLTHAVQWSGFGLPPADTEPGEEETQEAPAASIGRSGDSSASVTSLAGRAATRDRRARGTAGAARPRARAGAAPTGPAAPAAPAPGAARRQAELDERLAQEAAERAARRREEYEEAERLVTASAAAAAAAVSAEDGLEAEVRDLEQRLTQARADLAGVRMRARHAETAERRARQALDRLPSE
jgi:hypothetical protein